MSDRTPSEPEGTLNSDRVAPGIARDQPIEAARQDAEDAGTMRVGDDGANAGASAGQGSSGAASPGRHVAPDA